MAVQDADFNFEKGIGSFYSIGKDLTPIKKYSPVSISNGLAWNSEGSTLYYIDSFSHQVWGFDFDLKSGSISKCRATEFADHKQNRLPIN